MLPEGIYRGAIRHRRIQPKHHSFRYPLALTLVDLNQLDSTVANSRLWSRQRRNLVSFFDQDYGKALVAQYGQGQTDQPLIDALKIYVKQQIGADVSGKIQMLTQPRILGYTFNPVSFYFCFNDQEQLQCIVAEITNTPWDERFCYCLDTRDQSHDNAQPCYQFTFQKEFHVSPFMPMALAYDWRFSLKNNHIAIHMRLLQNNALQFDATYNADHQPFTAATMRQLPLRYPLQCLAVVWRIYWHALRLKLKNIPFYPHPKTLQVINPQDP